VSIGRQGRSPDFSYRKRRFTTNSRGYGIEVKAVSFRAAISDGSIFKRCESFHLMQLAIVSW
jgi:hypothetical protein